MKNRKNLRQGILLIFGFLAMTAAGVNWHMAIASWLAPLFLLSYTRNSKAPGFMLFMVVCIGSGIIGSTSLSVFSPLIAKIFTGTFFGISYGLAYLLDRLLYTKSQAFYSTLIFPTSVVLVEYLGSFYMSTWGVTAHTQYGIEPLTQIISVTGLLGLSFLVSWFASIVNWIYEDGTSVSAIKRAVPIYGVVLLLVIIYGEVRMTFFPSDSKTVKVAAITSDPGLQNVFGHDFELLKAYTPASASAIPARIFSHRGHINGVLQSTLMAADEGAKIIVWNEYALILDQEQSDSVRQSVMDIAKEKGVYVLMSALVIENGKPKPFDNKSVLIIPDGGIGWDYRKSALIPQSEGQIINAGDFKVPFFDSEFGRLGNVICYDADVPLITKQVGQLAIDILLVPAYDWPEITPFHSQMASFASIENGFSMVRPNGSGLAAVYDYHGRVIAKKNTYQTDSKILYADVPTKGTTTVYAKFGDGFIYICVLWILLIIGLRIKNRNEKPSVQINYENGI